MLLHFTGEDKENTNPSPTNQQLVKCSSLCIVAIMMIHYHCSITAAAQGDASLLNNKQELLILIN